MSGDKVAGQKANKRSKIRNNKSAETASITKKSIQSLVKQKKGSTEKFKSYRSVRKRMPQKSKEDVEEKEKKKGGGSGGGAGRMASREALEKQMKDREKVQGKKKEEDKNYVKNASNEKMDGNSDEEKDNDGKAKMKEELKEVTPMPSMMQNMIPTTAPTSTLTQPTTLDEKGKDAIVMAVEAEKEIRNMHFTNWVDGVLAGGIKQIKRDYQELAKIVIKEEEECKAYLKNPTKNRYDNIPCLDKTRIKLSDDEEYYIHGNRIKIGMDYDRFICTQGPLDNTINDFWRMAIANEVAYIVMLCDFTELGESKCAKYFSLVVGQSMEFESCKVTTELGNEWTDAKVYKDEVMLRQLRVQPKNGKESLVIKHFQWMNWPDHGMPESCETTLKTLEVMRRYTKRNVIIHCSAGIGRSGTFLLVESLINAIQNARKVVIKECFGELRRDRAKMVQTYPQFVYAIRCAIEYLLLKGRLSDRKEKWEELLNDMEKVKKKAKAQKMKGSKRSKSKGSADIINDNDKEVSAMEPDGQDGEAFRKMLKAESDRIEVEKTMGPMFDDIPDTKKK